MKAIHEPAIFENEGFRLTASRIEILPRAALAMAGLSPEEDLELVREWFEELKQAAARSRRNTSGYAGRAGPDA
jgi:hypothetical protein